MPRFIKVFSLLFSASLLFGCASSTRPSAETWAFCGVSPKDPYFERKTRSLANDAGIDATFGPCMPPDWITYTTSNPGARYVDPQEYMRVLHMNAKYGMKTIVYDARLWSDDPRTRQVAIDLWMPHISHIRAWDLGDEFDPDTDDWDNLVSRWNIIRTYIEPVTGVGPFTNHLGIDTVLTAALDDLDGQYAHLSYDAYDVEASLLLAQNYDMLTSHLMCAINVLNHGSYTVEASQVKDTMKRHRDAGCDSFLIFGDMPYNTPGFTGESMLTNTGQPTSIAFAVRDGSTA